VAMTHTPDRAATGTSTIWLRRLVKLLNKSKHNNSTFFVNENFVTKFCSNTETHRSLMLL
jgi:hypothetical protein